MLCFRAMRANSFTVQDGHIQPEFNWLQKDICVIKWINIEKKKGLIISGVCSKYLVILMLQQSSFIFFFLPEVLKISV